MEITMASRSQPIIIVFDGSSDRGRGLAREMRARCMFRDEALLQPAQSQLDTCRKRLTMADAESCDTGDRPQPFGVARAILRPPPVSSRLARDAL
jgi:hypothetical protein